MKLRLLPFLLLANVTLFAQTTTESLSMGPGYGNDVYYSLTTGMVQTNARNDWHIAFTTRIVDAAVLTNTVEGVNLYIGSTNTSDWATFDTTGMSWSPLHNSDLAWEEGSFNDGATGHPDYGWGNYNNTTHNVIGSKIFVVQFPDTLYKKIMIESMKTTGDFQFKIADLDGGNEMTKTFNKADYTGNFFYYDVKQDTAFSKEPASATWDLVFTKYEAQLAPGVYYNVTGALKNIGVEASAAKGIDTNMVDWNNHPAKDTSKNIIGHDWKNYEFTPAPGGWVIADSTTYFVKADNGDLYRIIFKTWDGASTGNFTFTKTLISTIGIAENPLTELKVYPNPANNVIRFDVEEDLEIEIINLNGQVVKSSSVELNESVDVSELASGTYIVAARSATKNFVSKIIIQ
jgi:hypothetical protein